MRGTQAFVLPYGGVVNDYAAFYFSPITAFARAIHQGNVEVISPTGLRLGQSTLETRAFFVVDVEDAFEAHLPICYSDAALNSQAPMPTILADPAHLETHVKWDLFDDEPLTARIPEIGYAGVCKYFMNTDVPARYQKRKQHRMAEFLVREKLPIEFVSCIVVPNSHVLQSVLADASAHDFRAPVLLNRSCFV